jgi:membrane associated rhomboid family serine protease
MTLLLIAITFLISYSAFQKTELLYRYQFNAYQIIQRKQWYRILTYGFLHADWNHLLVNMFVLFFFGSALENYFDHYLGSYGIFYFLFLYISAIIISSAYDLFKHKNNFYYNAVGASGATSAVVFTSIFFDPLGKLYFMFVLPIPGILFAIGYLYYSYTMSKKNIDNIGHTAHFWGALYGFVFPILIKPQLFSVFLQKVFNF